MKRNDVTMVNPQQIVNKGLKGCSSTRTVMTFARKYGVPNVWWTPTRNQKVMLVDWPQFRTMWNQYYSQKQTATTTWRSSTHPTRSYKTTSRSTTSGTKFSGKTQRQYPYSKYNTRSNTTNTSYRTPRTTRRVKRAA